MPMHAIGVRLVIRNYFATDGTHFILKPTAIFYYDHILKYGYNEIPSNNRNLSF